MFNFLTSLGYCELPSVLNVIYFIKNLFKIIFIVVPIGMIVMVSLDLFKNVLASNDENMKKNVRMALLRILALILMFFIPSLVNFVMISIEDSIGDKIKFLSCYSNANKDTIAKYQAVYDEEKAEEEREQQEKMDKALEDAKKRDDDVIPRSPGSGGSSGGKNKDKNYNKTIFIGDSRTVHMCFYVTLDENEDCDIAKSAMGIDWFEDTALPALKEKLKNDEKVNVVITMGANDMLFDRLYDDNRAERYAELFNQLAKDYPNTNFMIVSVTQVDDAVMIAQGKDLRDSDAVTFNDTVKSKINSDLGYCDVYSMIKGKYYSEDGIHYDKDTYQLIYDSIHKCI